MAPISAEEVAKYLEDNPGFFLGHPELVRPSGMLDDQEQGDNLVNIKDRLFERLNGERLELMGLLEETIELVRENEQIEADFLAIEHLLLQASPESVSLADVAEEIERRFSLDHVSFLLFEEAKEALPPGENSGGRVHLVGGTDGPRDESVLLEGPLEEGAGPPFPEESRADLRSTASVLLREGDESFGLLLLGSKDPGRYAAGMATQLLDRLAKRLGMGIRLILRFAEAGLHTGAPNLKAAPESAAKTA